MSCSNDRCCYDKAPNDSEEWCREWLAKSKIPYSFLCQTDGRKLSPDESEARKWKRADFIVRLPRRRLALDVKYLGNSVSTVLSLKELREGYSFAHSFDCALYFVGYAKRNPTLTYWLHSKDLNIPARREMLVQAGKLKPRDFGAFDVLESAWLKVETEGVPLQDVWSRILTLDAPPKNRKEA